MDSIARAGKALEAEFRAPNARMSSILDITLPGEDGLAFCRELRRRSEVPVIFLSATQIATVWGVGYRLQW